jgi:putative two-component system response regulator
MALADVLDALTSDRPYKSAWSADEANAYIIEQRGSQFDPDVVDAFESELEEFAEIHRALADV